MADSQLEILNVSVDRFSRILLQDAFLRPDFEIVGGPCVLIVVVIVKSGGFPFDYANDIIFAFLVELPLLGAADDIIRGRNAATHITNNASIKPKRFERLDFHTRDSMLDT